MRKGNLHYRTYYSQPAVSKTITAILNEVIDSSLKLANPQLNKELLEWFDFVRPFVQAEVDKNIKE